MAIFNLRVSPAMGRSVVNKYEYNNREGKYSPEVNQEKYSDKIYSDTFNLPSFATSSNHFWEALEKYERINSNDFREIEFSLPHELSVEENIELAKEYADKLFGDKYVYSLAIHSRPSEKEEIDNIHCHIIFSERELDGIERSEEKFFKHYNSKLPEKGGCKKSREWNKYSKLYQIRELWADTANEKLKNYEASITHKSLKAQRLDALLEEKYLEAEKLDRDPVHIEHIVKKFGNKNNKKYNEMLEFYEKAQEMKKLKEKIYKFRKENYEEENKKAKYRFFNNIKEEISTISLFSVENFKEKDNELKIEEYYTFENAYKYSIDNAIIRDKKLKRLKQIEQQFRENSFITRAYDNLTNKEYSYSLKKLSEIEKSLSITPEDEFLIREKKEVTDYLESIRNDIELNEQAQKMIYVVEKKAAIEREHLLEDIKKLKEDKFRDLAKSTNPNIVALSKMLEKEERENLPKYNEKYKEITNKTREYKEMMDNFQKDVTEKLYLDYPKGKEIFEKYLLLEELKKKYKNKKNIEVKHNDKKYKISEIEKLVRDFEKTYNIRENINKKMETYREIYKGYRQEQDDALARVCYCKDKLREAKIARLEREEDERIFFRTTKKIEIEKNGSYEDKLLYNCQVDKYKEKGFDFEAVKLPFSPLSVMMLSDKLKKQIDDLILQNKELEKDLKILDNLKDKEKLKEYILDSETNGAYSKCKLSISFYEKEVVKGGKEYDYNLEMYNSLKKELTGFENKYIITAELENKYRAKIREQNLEKIVKLQNNREKLGLLFRAVKKANINKAKPEFTRILSSLLKINSSSIVDENESYSKGIRAIEAGSIKFEEDTEEKAERLKEYSRGIEL